MEKFCEFLRQHTIKTARNKRAAGIMKMQKVVIFVNI